MKKVYLFHKYYYIFRINKSLIVGCGSFDKKDKIDTIVEKIISDKVTDDINNIYDWQGEEDTQLPQNYVDKKENKKNYLLIVLILLFVLILVIGVIVLIVKRNKAKKNDVL